MRDRTPKRPATVDSRPLYAQVRSVLTERISSGELKPGAPLPSEFEIASELGVSQGTVRKALDALARDNLIERHQGRGTFVREHTPADVLFRFFQLFDDDGRQVLPDSRDVSIALEPATPITARRLRLPPGADIVRIERTRTRDGQPFIFETIATSARIGAELLTLERVPNTLYDLLQKRCGVTIARTEEHLTAVAAEPGVAARLAIADGTPLLQIDRIAYAIDDQPVEWRVSLCHLQGVHYRARLGRD